MYKLIKCIYIYYLDVIIFNLISNYIILYCKMQKTVNNMILVTEMLEDT